MLPEYFSKLLLSKRLVAHDNSPWITATVTTRAVVPKYIGREIAQIDPLDIKESHEEGYPTVLIVGARQYLSEVEKQLRPIYSQLSYRVSPNTTYGFCEAYEFLLRDPRNNFGWRILMEMVVDIETQQDVLASTEDGTALVDLLDQNMVDGHLEVVQAIKALKDEQMAPADVKEIIDKVIGAGAQEIVEHFSTKEPEEEPALDTSQPTILLTSLKGCKGLSAGHVFIVGAHVGSIPRDDTAITDVDISQFIVALTRTRKQCHILSNNWLISPVDKNKKFLPKYRRTPFISWVDSTLVHDLGELKAKDFK